MSLRMNKSVSRIAKYSDSETESSASEPAGADSVSTGTSSDSEEASPRLQVLKAVRQSNHNLVAERSGRSATTAVPEAPSALSPPPKATEETPKATSEAVVAPPPSKPAATAATTSASAPTSVAGPVAKGSMQRPAKEEEEEEEEEESLSSDTSYTMSVATASVPPTPAQDAIVAPAPVGAAAAPTPLEATMPTGPQDAGGATEPQSTTLPERATETASTPPVADAPVEPEVVATAQSPPPPPASPPPPPSTPPAAAPPPPPPAAQVLDNDAAALRIQCKVRQTIAKGKVHLQREGSLSALADQETLLDEQEGRTLRKLLIQDSWEQLCEASDVGATFYAALFDADPSLAKTHFRGVDVEALWVKFMTMLDAVVSALDTPDDLAQDFQALGLRHAKYGVVEAHYALVGSALMHTFATKLGSDFTDDARNAWSELYASIQGPMVAAQATEEGRTLFAEWQATQPNLTAPRGLYFDDATRRIYVCMDGYLRRIAKPAIFNKLFAVPLNPKAFKRGAVAPLGTPLPEDAALLRAEGAAAVYLRDTDHAGRTVKRHVQSAEAMAEHELGWDKVQTVTAEEVDGMAEGDPILHAPVAQPPVEAVAAVSDAQPLVAGDAPKDGEGTASAVSPTDEAAAAPHPPVVETPATEAKAEAPAATTEAELNEGSTTEPPPPETVPPTVATPADETKDAPAEGVAQPGVRPVSAASSASSTTSDGGYSQDSEFEATPQPSPQKDTKDAKPSDSDAPPSANVAPAATESVDPALAATQRPPSAASSHGGYSEDSEFQETSGAVDKSGDHGDMKAWGMESFDGDMDPIPGVTNEQPTEEAQEATAAAEATAEAKKQVVFAPSPEPSPSKGKKKAAAPKKSPSKKAPSPARSKPGTGSPAPEASGKPSPKTTSVSPSPDRRRYSGVSSFDTSASTTPRSSTVATPLGSPTKAPLAPASDAAKKDEKPSKGAPAKLPPVAHPNHPTKMLKHRIKEMPLIYNVPAVRLLGARDRLPALTVPTTRKKAPPPPTDDGTVPEQRASSQREDVASTVSGAAPTKFRKRLAEMDDEELSSAIREMIAERKSLPAFATKHPDPPRTSQPPFISAVQNVTTTSVELALQGSKKKRDPREIIRVMFSYDNGAGFVPIAETADETLRVDNLIPNTKYLAYAMFPHRQPKYRAVVGFFTHPDRSVYRDMVDVVPSAPVAPVRDDTPFRLPKLKRLRKVKAKSPYE